MSTEYTRRLRAEASSGGWTLRRTSKGHLKFTHPDVEGCVYASGTPSDHRALENTLAEMRRKLRISKPSRA